MYMITRSCPSCGAPVEIFEEMKQRQCPYCGVSVYITDSGALTAEIKKEMSGKSLSEKYENLRDEKEQGAADKKERLEKLKPLERYGIIVNDALLSKSELTAPVRLKDEYLSMFTEAVKLIKPDKWKKAKVYKKEDVIEEKDKFNNLNLKLDEYCSYIKYKWPDDTVHYWRCDFPYEFLKKESANSLPEIASLSEKLIKNANRHMKFAPLLYGEQEYVVLRYGYRGNIYDMVLFRDGFVFDEGAALNENANIILTEKWLLQEIGYINGDILEEKERKDDYWDFITYRWAKRRERF